MITKQQPSPRTGLLKCKVPVTTRRVTNQQPEHLTDTNTTYASDQADVLRTNNHSEPDKSQIHPGHWIKEKFTIHVTNQQPASRVQHYLLFKPSEWE